MYRTYLIVSLHIICILDAPFLFYIFCTFGIIFLFCIIVCKFNIFFYSQYQNAYNSKLWVGDCFKFDSSDRGEKVEKYSRSENILLQRGNILWQVIMADQLAGYWYRKTSGKKGLIETNKVLLFIHMLYKKSKSC